MHKSRLISGLGALAMIVGAFLIFWFEPTAETFFPACPIYKVSGFACPGCGMTRAFHAILQGDVAGAFRFNIFMPLMFGILAFIFVSMAVHSIGGRRLRLPSIPAGITVACFVLMMIYGVVRNIPVYPFNILFP